mmetsp:Transcript_1362/g.1836  ORF Transcript_1362/g.1836 Transcript_1362/m.1836 type:complete len:377 (-) Transcript_1362:104-1234(-)|eukprot:CAMPEP_0117748858 /NCGR_PEP_ID=MMETSP0947-20121206/9399_1 /TAXON_ID=44440 /ORGANISM="Chattonella subsalsa, Strain CCMP2191" /LENGTH=376 /DNA_ID=CAMNT_0005566667 /DNA_START=142 /DNA_END=1272 /DNA_ORIENTATION=+
MAQDGENNPSFNQGGNLLGANLPPQLSQMSPEQLLDHNSQGNLDHLPEAPGAGAGPPAPPSVVPIFNEQGLVRKTGRQRIVEFLKSHRCFDLLRTSGKVVVFDTSIPIQLAFYALVEHEMECAPLWDSVGRRFQGLMTISDYIHVVRATSNNDTQNRQSIQQTLNSPEGHRMKQEAFIACSVEQTLYEASQLLAQQKIKFLPIATPDEAAVMACINETDVLDYLVATFREQRRLFEDSISSLNIGTYNNICTVRQDTRLRDVLSTLENYDIQTVPVVDAQGRVQGLYTYSDFTFLAQALDQEAVARNMQMSVGEMLTNQQNEGMPNRLHTCSPQDTLQTVFELFAEVRFRTLVCVDSEYRCVGIVSVHDLLSYFTD